jgi:hypothetical protein
MTLNKTTKTKRISLSSAFLGLTLAAIAVPPVSLAQHILANNSVTVVDVIPTYLSAEHDQNSEPSIAVFGGSPNPTLLIHSFNKLRQDPSPLPTYAGPYYTSTDGGFTWVNNGFLRDSDTTVAWSPDGVAYAAAVNPFAMNTMDILSSFGPAGGTPFAPLAKGHYASSGVPDQPWINVLNIGGTDRIYVGFNDAGHTPKTASVHFSLDGGSTWNSTSQPSKPPVVIESIAPSAGQDFAVRIEAANDGHTVYAVFQRRTQKQGSGSKLRNLLQPVLPERQRRGQLLPDPHQPANHHHHHYRFIANNRSYGADGLDTNFTTAGLPPGVVRLDPTYVSGIPVINRTVNGHGNNFTWYFEVGTIHDIYSFNVGDLNATNNSPQLFSVTMTNNPCLYPSTTYYYVLVAYNAWGYDTSYVEKTFTTPA